ncbi:MAG: hypothetical protein KGZ83_08805 [Sulfuricella sp.]|nr:hypothetical protein [Sulfuricella sp.]
MLIYSARGEPVLVLRSRQGPIGREMFAIKGVKLPSKAKSGTCADFLHQAGKSEFSTAS